MVGRTGAIVGMIAALAAGLAFADDAAAPPTTFGIWRNPKDSVHIEIKPCANGMGACGVVVWANDKAKRDARKGGTQELIGLQIFRDFEKRDDGVWRGRVFVPDLNRTFSGTAEALSPTSLKAKGCVIMLIACKAQIWTRIDTPS